MRENMKADQENTAAKMNMMGNFMKNMVSIMTPGYPGAYLGAYPGAYARQPAQQGFQSTQHVDPQGFASASAFALTEYPQLIPPQFAGSSNVQLRRPQNPLSVAGTLSQHLPSYPCSVCSFKQSTNKQR